METRIESALINPSDALRVRWPDNTALVPIFRYGGHGAHRRKGSVPRVVAFSLISSIDVERVCDFRWFIFHPNPYNIYAVRSEKDVTGKTVSIFLHRFIMNLPPGRTIQVDHQNGIGLDNIRSNLRTGTQADNSQNQRKRPNLTSKYRGVHFSTKYKNWVGYAYLNKKVLGKRHFKTEEEAAVYARMLREKHMPFTKEDR